MFATICLVTAYSDLQFSCCHPLGACGGYAGDIPFAWFKAGHDGRSAGDFRATNRADRKTWSPDPIIVPYCSVCVRVHMMCVCDLL